MRQLTYDETNLGRLQRMPGGPREANVSLTFPRSPRGRIRHFRSIDINGQMKSDGTRAADR